MEPRLAQPSAPGEEGLQLAANAESASGRTPRPGSLRQLLLTVAPWVLLGGAVVAVVLPFWPGRMDADTLNEIGSARSGTYTDQYSPILEAMWHPFIHHGIGPGWILTGQVLVFIVAAYSLLRLTLRPLGAAVAGVVICLTPMVFGGMGLVGRDQWFLTLLTACFAAVGRTFQSHGTARRLWFVAALVLAWLTLAARENASAAVFVPLALLAGLWLVHRRPAMLRRRRGLALWSLVIAVVVTAVMFESQSLVYRALNVQTVDPTAALFVYDLAMLSHHDRKNYFPPNVMPGGSLATVDARSSVDTISPMIGPVAPILWPILGQRYRALESAWKHRIKAEPLEYLRERALMMGDQIGLTNDSIWVYHPYIDGSTDTTTNVLGYKTSFVSANNVANDYMSAFTDRQNNGDFLFAVWAYLLFCLVAAVWLLRGRTWKRLLVGGLALCTLTYQPTFLFLGQGSNYRYERPCVAIALLILALGIPAGWRRAQPYLGRYRRSAERPVPARA